MIGFCEKCDKKETCTELCDLCEDYVSQDYVSIEEGLININIENRENGVDWGNVNLGNYETIRNIIISMYLKGKTTK